jgi:DnaJ-like protein
MADTRPPHSDPYSVLGLTPQASSQEIRAAYQRLIGEIVAGHPAPVQRQAIEEAFETLGDPIRRLRYDAQASAPAPPRFQMPAVNMPGRRLAIQMPSLTLRKPRIPRVDPLIAAAIGLVVVVALAVVLLPLLRGRGSNAPAQSVADLVGTATATPTSPSVSSATAPRAGSPVLGLNSGRPGGLVPLSPPGTPGGLLSPQQPATSSGNEPPFLTGSAVVDSLRAVLAASAVRNPPSQAGVPGGAANAAAPSNRPTNSVVGTNPPASSVNAAPAGVPLTNVGALPPVAAAVPPNSGVGAASAAQPTTPPPTPTPAPNHIALPSGPIGASGAVSANRGPAAPTSSASGPNRFGPPPSGSP